MKITLYTANVSGDKTNCKYPNKNEIEDAAALAKAVAMDNVCGHFKNDYRSNDNFISCDSIMMDCDNDHTEDPDRWITPEMVAAQIPDVQMMAVPSRNHMKVKDGKEPRPKHHYMFPIDETDDAEAVAELKTKIQKKFPFFDDNALDAARFVFGAPCKEEDVFWQDGWETIDAVIDDEDDIVPDDEALEDMLPMKPLGVIPNGQRNKTLNLFAGKVLKRYGDCDRAYQIFLEESKKCETPLTDTELKTIYNSALKFYKNKVVNSDGYVPPTDYNDPNKQAGYLKPEDYSDIGEAKVLVREYGHELLFTPATGYMRYDGRVWVESKQKAVGAMEEFLDLQYFDALMYCAEKKKACKDAGVDPDAKRQKLTPDQARVRGKHDGILRDTVECRVISADRCKALASGAEEQDGNDNAHHHKRHYR